jgi:hypothetical protein
MQWQTCFVGSSLWLWLLERRRGLWARMVKSVEVPVRTFMITVLTVYTIRDVVMVIPMVQLASSRSLCVTYPFNLVVFVPTTLRPMYLRLVYTYASIVSFISSYTTYRCAFLYYLSWSYLHAGVLTTTFLLSQVPQL